MEPQGSPWAPDASAMVTLGGGGGLDLSRCDQGQRVCHWDRRLVSRWQWRDICLEAGGDAGTWERKRVVLLCRATEDNESKALLWKGMTIYQVKAKSTEIFKEQNVKTDFFLYIKEKRLLHKIFCCDFTFHSEGIILRKKYWQTEVILEKEQSKMSRCWCDRIYLLIHTYIYVV